MGKIIIKRGDITKENVDVIVNAANMGLHGGGGVDGAIHRAGGRTILEECLKIGRCQTGEAVITTAGVLMAKKVIHTVGPVWHGGSNGEPKLLRSCYFKSFDLAKRHHLKTIAFPAISTGVYGYPKEPAAGIAIEEGLRVIDDFDEIRYLCFSPEDLSLYKSVYKAMTEK